MSFSLLGRKKELVISTPTGVVANRIGRSTVYTAFRINNRVEKNAQYKIRAQWSHQSCLINDKISMIDLKLLISIYK